jgi:hypothetical protein
VVRRRGGTDGVVVDVREGRLEVECLGRGLGHVVRAGAGAAEQVVVIDILDGGGLAVVRGGEQVGVVAEHGALAVEEARGVAAGGQVADAGVAWGEVSVREGWGDTYRRRTRREMGSGPPWWLLGLRARRWVRGRLCLRWRWRWRWIVAPPRVRCKCWMRRRGMAGSSRSR